jgi:hypothetical protein
MLLHASEKIYKKQMRKIVSNATKKYEDCLGTKIFQKRNKYREHNQERK